MKIFQPCHDGEENGHHWYEVTEKNPLQHFCTLDYLAVGLSFRQSSCHFATRKEQTGFASMGLLQQGDVAKYAHMCCAFNYQQLKNVLSSLWTFSVVLDMSNHMSTCYFDICAWVFWYGIICNFHVVALPISGHPTDLAMFAAFV
jgi:hypothetical protein